ncbi:testis-expressed sequence 2 -like [Brachionus plicatilis]|uniref:Testis-expressed sequence 2-like n=1 Tax=Brachionus plicatilis TaxID=10195 RepID=A0A3M7Q9Z8_BRAPC|nr:testis-expressed sequence 2 -like [Brachionus plicatilis]
MKYIKKAMENVSNCQLLLNVELKRVTGTVALNIPAHPSDRIWYGFVTKPKMDVVATPQVGDTEVSYSAISDFIADKLKLEFQKLLVYPNMDDFYIPLLNSEVKSL